MYLSSSSQNARDPSPYGLKLLHENRNSIVDIVFVHGLNGDRERTWTDPGTGLFWPQSLLPTSNINARIFTFGYDANPASLRDMVSQNCVGNHAMNLLTALATYREDSNTNGRSIIFVTHSLGGIVCQDSLVQSNQRPDRHLRKIIDNTRGIVFLGTPHRGTSLASWVENLAKAIGVVSRTNSRIVQLLRSDSEVLERVLDGFHAILRERDIQITCFYEELPIRGIGFVVPRDSASIPGRTNIGIHGNHMDMTKFTSANDAGYVAVAGELRRWVRELGETKPIDSGSSNETWGIQAITRSLASNPSSDSSTLKSNILRWLSKAMVLESHQQIKSDRCKDTCQWFLESSEVIGWKDATDSSLLWVHGKPGCGKSTLISALIDESRAKEDVGNRCAFFYCKMGDERYNSASAIFRALLLQFFSSASNESLHPAIVDAYFSKEGLGPEPASLTASEAAHLLFEVSKEYTTTKIIIDGLDECEGQERERLLSELHQRLQKRPQGLKIAISSRDNDDIVRKLQHDRTIAVDKDANSADLAKFIKIAVEESQLLRGQISSDLRQKVIHSLERDADGMFLWAKLQLRALKEAKSREILCHMLDEPPAGLLGLYQRLEANVRDQQKDSAQLAFRALNWSVWAIRPLSPDEFRDALWYGNKNSPFDRSELTLDLVLDVCQNFLIYDQNLGHIRFIHSSAQQYIRSRNEAEAESVHRMIATACLSYLTMTSFDTLAQEQAEARVLPPTCPDREVDICDSIDWIRENYQAMKPLLATCPFLGYAGSCWCFHADKGGPQSWLQEYTWIWESQSAKFTQWLDLHDVSKGGILTGMGDELVQLSDYFDRNAINLVQISGMLGYENLLWFGLQKRPQDTSITFNLAAYYNREEIIDKMLSDPSFRGKIPHLEALLHISCLNHPKTIWLILDSFEDTAGPDRACTGLRVILSGSFVSGNVNIAEEAISRLRRLCSFGETLIENRIFETAVVSSQAAGLLKKIDTTVLKSLNEVREFILGEDQQHYWTYFTMVSATGSKAMMEMIISLGLIDEEPKQLELALTLASMLGYIDILPLILQQQNFLSMQGPLRVALSNAISSPNENHESIVKLLLDSLDPVSPLFTSIRGSYYPLGLAAEFGHLPSVQNLLKRGAPVSIKDGSGKTALDYAVESNHVNIIRELRS